MQNIIQCYKNHPSIIKIKEDLKNLGPFDFNKPAVEDISLIIKYLNPIKARGPDCIPLKNIKFASNVIDSHHCNIIIKDLEKKGTQKSQKQHWKRFLNICFFYPRVKKFILLIINTT